MKTTGDFRNSVMIRRPYLKEAWIEHVLHHSIQTQQQSNGRIRIVTEADGETVHNAFPDRRFKP